MTTMKFIYSTLTLGLIIWVSSCTNDFENINTNPNAPIEVETEFLLRQVIYDYGEQMSYEGFVAGNLLGQYFTAVDFNLFDRHSLSEPQFGGNPWPIIYTNLRDNELILQSALDNPIDAVYEGPARILKAYMTAALTDIFGDVPYREALRGKAGNVTPVYDFQEDIYLGEDGIIDNLDKAIIALESYSGTQILKGDILYNGDLNNWIKFAKSLKLKYLMRIRDVANVAVELSDLIYAGGFISDNSENATFSFTDGQPNNFRLATARVGDFNLFVMSETIEEVLSDFNDPRIETFFRPTGADDSQYNGLLNGPNASETSIVLSDYSLSGTIFREQTSMLQANFMTAWETEYLLAEAAAVGAFFGNATVYYNRATELAFEYWNTEMPEDYLTIGPAAFVLSGAGANPVKQIVTQKWIANIINGYEGWIEYRRTGYPELKTVSASLNDDLIPVRMPYPTDEEALNGDNFRVASQATNGNSINAKVWWDVD